MDFSELLALAAERKWIPLAALAAWAVVRLLKSDTKLRTVPARWRPVLAIVVGVLASTLDKVIAGGDWRLLAPEGVAVGVIAVLVHVFGVDVLRGGKDIAIPKSLSVRPPPPPPGSDGGGLIVPPVPPPRLPRISDGPEPPAAAIEELPKPKKTLLFAGVVFASISLQSCALFTPQNASRLLDLSKTLCILANFASDDTAVQAICGIVDREVGPMQDLLRAERERVASERAAAQRELVSAGRCDEAVVP